uniref:Uncharacterized protein n=1 Tax=Rhizophora mucronata TaxID=61149 RepID=A0A2P2NT50_RHIMU
MYFEASLHVCASSKRLQSMLTSIFPVPQHPLVASSKPY